MSGGGPSRPSASRALETGAGRAPLHHAALFRRAAYSGARYAPLWFVRWAPVVIGPVLGSLSGDVRRAISANVTRILPDASPFERRRLATRTLVQFARCLTDSLAAGRPDYGRVVRVQGAEALLGELTMGRGAILVTAHVGPWDRMAVLLAGRIPERPVMLVMAEEAATSAGTFQDQRRAAVGVTVVRLTEDPLSALPILEHLERGGIVAMQCDRVRSVSSAMEGTLFGRAFPVPTGPFQLAGLARVGMVSALSARLPDGTDTVVLGPARYPSRRPGTDELREHVRVLLGEVEAHVRRFPDQWFHFVTPEVEAETLEGLRKSAERVGRSA